MLIHASFSLAGLHLSADALHPDLGEILEAPVSTLSNRGYHRTLKPADDEIVLHWSLFFSF